MSGADDGSEPGIAPAADVLTFWRALGPANWFKPHETVDADIRRRFLATYEAAAAGRLSQWEETAESALALIIVLDQFPRNMFRGTARAFAADPLARAVAERAMAQGFDRAFDVAERRFVYLPLMHSEDAADQDRCAALCRAAGDAEGTKYADIHADIIRRFGRFPHRNAALGRVPTQDEQDFLAAGGFSG